MLDCHLELLSFSILFNSLAAVELLQQWSLLDDILQKKIWPMEADMKEKHGLILFNSLCKIYVGV